MVHLPRVEATLAPLALLTKTVYLPWIKLQQPDARLIRLSEKTNNWTFNLASDGDKDPNAQPSSWSFHLDNILFDRGRIAIDDKVSKADVEILVDPLGKPLPFSEVTGTKAKGDAASVGDYVFGLTAKDATTISLSAVKGKLAACWRYGARARRSLCRRTSVPVTPAWRSWERLTTR